MKMRRLLGAGAALVLAMSSTFASADSKTLSIGYVDGWSDSVATTHVAAEVIKQKLGYDVKLQAVATGIMWQGVATGKLDAMLSAWLPVTHGEYWAKNKEGGRLRPQLQGRENRPDRAGVRQGQVHRRPQDR
jgi:glycine betaine/proline transport system substrate-binding protein